MQRPARLERHDLPDLREFLARAELTHGGLDAPEVRLWILRDAAGVVQGSTGYERATTGPHVLIRSVAVKEDLRRLGLGLWLAQYALDEAAREGARCAWLFSRRSGPFWQHLGFVPADRDTLVAALADTHQVRLFQDTGQLEREVAWSRPLPHSER